MSNGEGYKTPTQDMAIGRETAREKLRRKYGIREGDIVIIAINVSEDGKKDKKKIRVKVKGIYKHFVVLQWPGGYLQDMLWMDFEQARL